jgi:site-specific DNA-cytosine methylase
MRILVACEYSGIVRDAFIAKGHNAVSCDLLPTERPGPHYQGDISDLFRTYNGINEFWFDIVIAFPPCTHLCVSGARWFKDKREEQKEAIEFFMMFTRLPYSKIVIENPIGIMSTQYRKPDQIIQPWQFGHGETKATCLWLKGLLKLQPTNIVEGREARIHKMPPGPNRWKERSRTFEGIANAMADQWG